METSALNARFLSQRGYPLGSSAHLHERFTVSADGSRLEYVLIVTDLENYTMPFELRRSWIWRAGEQVLAFNCAQ